MDVDNTYVIPTVAGDLGCWVITGMGGISRVSDTISLDLVIAGGNDNVPCSSIFIELDCPNNPSAPISWHGRMTSGGHSRIGGHPRATS